MRIMKTLSECLIEITGMMRSRCNQRRARMANLLDC